MTKPLTEISGLFKVFGPKLLSVMDRVKNGEYKDAILADTVIPLALKKLTFR